MEPTMFEEGLMLVLIPFMVFCIFGLLNLTAEESIRDHTEDYDYEPFGDNYFNICSVIKNNPNRKVKPSEDEQK